MRYGIDLAIACALTLFGCGGVIGGSGPNESDAGQAEPAMDAATLPFIDAGTVRWQDLYADYFGPNGVANCSAQTTCHGSPAEIGAATSGFVCGTNSDSCWQGINPLATSSNMGLTSTFLYAVLRKSSGNSNGTMPDKSTYVFQPYDLARIAAWIQEGARND